MTVTTLEPDEIARQHNYLASQASSAHVEVPGWLDPMPAAIAEAARHRDEVHDRWIELEDCLVVALSALQSADRSDAEAIRDAARAGKRMPKAIDRDALARATMYAYEAFRPANSELTRANATVAHAIEAETKTLTTQAVAVTRAELKTYAEHIAEAQERLNAAADAYRRAQEPLTDVRDLVRADMQYAPPSGLPNHPLTLDRGAMSHLSELCNTLEARGWVRQEAGASA
jgi:hypothetical protein